MIYAGDATTIDALDNKLEVLANGYDDGATQYTKTEASTFNSSCDNNMYVGFMYTNGQLRGLGISSTIKGKLDTWYNNNLVAFADKIDTNVGFCGDRTPYSNYTSPTIGGGTGTTQTYYASYVRLIYQLYHQKQTSASPTYKCENISDLYTVGTSNKGNKALINPIGLISAEEVSYAGGLFGNDNTSYYLYSGINYWTLSAAVYDSSMARAGVFFIHSLGGLGAPCVLSSYGIRPVINLRADTLILEGTTGTAENPYVVI